MGARATPGAVEAPAKVQRVPGDTRIDALASSALRNALRQFPLSPKIWQRVLYQPAMTADPNDPEQLVEGFVRVTLEVAVCVKSKNPASTPP